MNKNLSNSTKLLSKRILSSANEICFGGQRIKNVFILMCDTGGGHRASASAISAALQDQCPNRVNIKIVDIWTQYARWPFNRFAPVYSYLAKHPLLWRGFYSYGLFPPTKLITEAVSHRSCYDTFKKVFVAANPDLVVSVHPLCQKIPLSIVSEMNKRHSPANGGSRIPFVTVVTDLGGAHACWFDRRVDACYVPSRVVEQLAIQNHVAPSRIKLTGLPIRRSFWRSGPVSKNILRRKLGLAVNGSTVLLMGGGDGVGDLPVIACEIARALNASSTSATVPATLSNTAVRSSSQLIVVCGSNKAAFWQLSRELRGGPHLHVAVKGFVENVDEYMAASDCLVSKAGPGTIAECMTRGLPVVLSSFLPGQVQHALFRHLFF